MNCGLLIIIDTTIGVSEFHYVHPLPPCLPACPPISVQLPRPQHVPTSAQLFDFHFSHVLRRYIRKFWSRHPSHITSITRMSIQLLWSSIQLLWSSLHPSQLRSQSRRSHPLHHPLRRLLHLHLRSAPACVFIFIAYAQQMPPLSPQEINLHRFCKAHWQGIL